MSDKYSRRAIRLALLAAILLLAAMGTATYAWFTAANRQVSTQRISARTSQTELKLQVSTSQSFGSDAEETMIRQVNKTSLTELMPVSTDDLASFVYCPVTDNAVAATFRPVEGEQYYYHGRIYIRAAARNLPEGTMVSVYLDGSDGKNPILGISDGQMQNAARLGLHVGGDNAQNVILRLTDASNGAGSAMNTRVNGVNQPAGIVLHSAGTGAVTSVADPSLLWEECTMKTDGAAKELFRLKPNVTYPLDVYFYLEGCDPDCTNIIAADMAEIGLRFYGSVS